MSVLSTNYLQGGRIISKRIFLVMIVVSLMIFAVQPFAASAQATASATSNNGGAAAATAATLGGLISYSEVVAIGNASALGQAVTPASAAAATVTTTGPAAAWGASLGTPVLSTASVITSALPGGTATGTAVAFP